MWTQKQYKMELAGCGCGLGSGQRGAVAKALGFQGVGMRENGCITFFFSFNPIFFSGGSDVPFQPFPTRAGPGEPPPLCPLGFGGELEEQLAFPRACSSSYKWWSSLLKTGLPRPLATSRPGGCGCWRLRSTGVASVSCSFVSSAPSLAGLGFPGLQIDQWASQSSMKEPPPSRPRIIYI